jgi:hypothetical protein
MIVPFPLIKNNEQCQDAASAAPVPRFAINLTDFAREKLFFLAA